MTGPHLTRRLVVVLGFLSAVGPFAIDMYLASLPQIARELDAAPATVQLTLTAFLLGLGVGQLLLGPLSDMWGRRRVLLLATSAFTLTSIALVAAPTIEVFIVLRLVQGLAGAAGVVIARAIGPRGHRRPDARARLARRAGVPPSRTPPHRWAARHAIVVRPLRAGPDLPRLHRCVRRRVRGPVRLRRGIPLRASCSSARCSA
ncbi:MFS transporter [Microbacterium marinum]|uniref:MFS transporter n=1 Tax=Microbacterium marinum TaxID=421115 RepID=UPI00384FDDD8